MNDPDLVPEKQNWSAAELRKMPAAKRDAILRAAAERAAHDYETDPELTAFEAFGQGDLYGESANTTTRRDLAV